MNEILIVVFILSACSSVPTDHQNNVKEDKRQSKYSSNSIILNAKAQKVTRFNQDFIDLDLIFRAQSDLAFIFSWNLANLMYEDNILIEDIYEEVNPLFEKLKYSQILVENENHQVKLFIHTHQLSELIQLYQDENYDPVKNLKKGEEVVIKIRSVYCQDLKPTFDSNKIRFYYCFKPNEEMIQRGFNEYMLVSNWIKMV